MKKIKSRKWQSGKTGAVLVLSVCSMLLILNGIRKNAAQLQYQLQQYLLRSAQAMYVPSLVSERRFGYHRDRGSGSDKKHWRGFQWFSMWKIMQSMDRLLKMRRRSQRFWKVRRMTKMQSMKMEN